MATPTAAFSLHLRVRLENTPGSLGRLAVAIGEAGGNITQLEGFDVRGEFLDEDIVVNCTLQDTDAPLTFLSLDDLTAFRRGSLVVDVSCDEGMGFEWATPTTFEDPMFTVGGLVDYYAVDHSPSYLWDSASWENSEALLPFLPIVMAGSEAWDADETINRAIEVRDGHVVNPAILNFQGRVAEYPHPVA